MNEQGLLRQATRAALSGINMMIGRGRILLTVDNDGGPVQKIQAKVSAKETMDIARLAEFGFASRVPKDGDCAIIYLKGDRTNGIIVATGHQTYRFKLENDGEMAIYDAFGKSIWFKKDDGIVVEAGAKPITVNNAKGVTINTTDDITLNMGGKNVTINNPGSVVLGPAGKKVVVDGDPVVGGGGGHVQATQNVVKA